MPLLKKKTTIVVAYFLLAGCCLPACHTQPEQKPVSKKPDYIKPIPGTNEPIPAALAQQGEVLIAYSDCYTCHKKAHRSVGPAFTDIAKRYPANKAFIEMLAHKVIAGGSGSWGTPAMAAHPQLLLEDAKKMVAFILSLKRME
ncbi:MAG TPA: c-type cytochrome [Phnomibacter sp.]|nr:c-type cytochrome [Phnomibacter sp.]